tara:strand:- start:2102 stop:2500 length:399 start_codon:yes stop_codon:yes gene_type:complete
MIQTFKDFKVSRHICANHGQFDDDFCPECALNPLQPVHICAVNLDYYKNWLFLSTDGKRDYYFHPVHEYLSIVHSDMAHTLGDYTSPHMPSLKTNPGHYWKKECLGLVGYKELINFLLRDGIIELNEAYKGK